ncbi:MAG: hypothetical protein Q9226_001530 [Calogaya cf. arnoldii]
MGELLTSPGISSIDGSDDEPVESQLDRRPASQQSHDNEQSGTGTDPAPNPPGSPKAPTTCQKRRRVTRACDECRRKKIKCDGKQPCTHCTVYSYDCTFDQPSNRRRNPAPHYVEALENRLEKAESLLKTVLPDVNLDDPKYDAMMPQRMHAPIKQEEESLSSGIKGGSTVQSTNGLNAPDAQKDSLLESMVLEAGSLHLDDQGHYDFYGQSSGMIFLRRMREQFGDLLVKFDGTSLPFTKPSTISGRLNSSKSNSGSPMDSSRSNVHDLPAKSCARKLCSYALTDAAALFPFVHQPTFYTMFDRVYDTPRESYEPIDEKFLPLLYSVIALGCLFATAEESMLQSYGYESATDLGYLSYPLIARQLMDVTDCRDLSSLQALLIMIMFLQASSKLSTCYSHIGIALRSALRMGLHRSVPNQFSPIEQETRKRVFWCIRNMDIYVGALLGLPICLDNKDIDQELPLEVDDDCITEHEVLPMPTGKTSVVAAFNAHVGLVSLLAKTIRYVYPLHTMRSKSKHAYVVSHSKIREVEQDLQRWMEDLPMGLRQGGEAPPEVIRVQQLLRLSYGHIQMILYRPFLHYASQSIQARSMDKRSYACAAACVSVSRNIIHITSEMKRNGLLSGAYWFAMYTTLFAVLSLVFYVIENPRNAASQEILRDAHEGKDTLASLAPRSMAADRSSQYLALPEALKSGRLVSVSQKKRPAPSESPNPAEGKTNTNARANQSNEQSPIGRSNRSSTAETLDWESASGSRKNTPYASQPIHNDQSPFRRNPQQAFSPNNLHTATAPGFKQDLKAMEGMPTPRSARQANFSPQPAIGRGELPDLSTMMFPSNDPFAYPNQPMSILESLHGGNQGQLFDMQLLNNFSTGEGYSGINAPFYGPLPSYPMLGRSPNTNASHAGGDPAGLDGQSWNQGPGQGRYGGPSTGSGWDTMFGEDWSGAWTDSSFRQ